MEDSTAVQAVARSSLRRRYLSVYFDLSDEDLILPTDSFDARFVDPAVSFIRNKMPEDVKHFDVVDLELPNGVIRAESIPIDSVGNGRLIIAWHPGQADDDGNVLVEAGIRGRIDVLYSIHEPVPA